MPGTGVDNEVFPCQICMVVSIHAFNQVYIIEMLIIKDLKTAYED